MSLVLTPFQADEVSGLLDVASDDVANGDRQKVWATLDGRLLTVLDQKEAADELRWRADFLEEQAAEHGRNGGPAARSLRQLANQMEVG